MDRIHYSGDSILTGTAIAHALLDYAKALAEAESSDTVEIPTVREGGVRGRSEMLVGPASQLISDAVESEWDEPVDDELVADLTEKARRLRYFGALTGLVEAHAVDPGEGWSEFDEI